jgi:hypothetical protein
VSAPIRKRARGGAATALILGAGWALASPGGVPASGTSTTVRCPIATPTARPRPSFDFGTARLAVALPPGATFVAVPDGKPGRASLQTNGWIRAKLGWWAAAGAPRVTGRRLDAPARPLRVDMGPLSQAVPGGDFYPSNLYFSSGGCWRLTAVSGNARLVAVVRVVEP